MSTNSSTVASANKSGITYVVENTKYPDYIRNHAVFQKLNKINKIFPSIGLPNTQEECDYINTADVRIDAQNLLLSDIRNGIYRILQIYNVPSYLSNLANEVYGTISRDYASMIIEDQGRITLKFIRDIGVIDNKSFIKAGESVFKAYNKLAEKALADAKITLTNLESMPYFKLFSTSNIPAGKKLKIVFSSTGKEGLWDIATISMRGISSCQTWGSTQSRGLIGSMSSKYVGVIYLTSGDKFNEHGSKMIRRALVRFCINKNTKKPGLLVDRIYHSDDATIRTLFRDFLKKKTNFPVIFPGEPEWGLYELPPDSSWKVAPFQANEYTYMDNKIPWVPVSKKEKDLNPYWNRIAQLDNHMVNNIHRTIIKMLDEYCLDKTTHTEHFKGGVANLLVSISHHIGGTCYAALLVPRLYSYATNNSSFPDPRKYDNPLDYEKSVIRTAFIMMPTIFKIVASDSYPFTKFYPNSLQKFINLTLIEYKKELLTAYKNLLKN